VGLVRPPAAGGRHPGRRQVPDLDPDADRAHLQHHAAGDRPRLLPPLTQHFVGEVAKIAKALPNDRIAVQWDVCQEVLAWEGYYEPGPVDFRTETLDVLTKIGDAVPPAIELGYHLCYGSPADEHMVQPKDTGVMVKMTNAISARVRRQIDFFHLPVPKGAPTTATSRRSPH
jgi:hypothetical protein